MALVWALSLHEDPTSPVQVLGVSTSPGNTDADSAFASALALVQAAGAGDSVRVAHPRSAPAFLCHVLAGVPAGEAVTVVALGPLTNVARALQRCPGAWVGPTRRLVVMGGDLADAVTPAMGAGPAALQLLRRFGVSLPHVDMNLVLADVHATGLVLDVPGLHRTAVSIQAALHVALTPAVRDALTAGCPPGAGSRPPLQRGVPVVCALRDRVEAKPRTWLRRVVAAVLSGPGYDLYKHPDLDAAAFVPWDVVALAAVFVPDAFQWWRTLECRVRSDKWATVWGPPAVGADVGDPRVVQVPFGVNATMLWERMVPDTVRLEAAGPRHGEDGGAAGTWEDPDAPAVYPGPLLSDRKWLRGLAVVVGGAGVFGLLLLVAVWLCVSACCDREPTHVKEE